MSPVQRGVAVAILHVLIVLSLVGKYEWDRARLPREWVKAAPVDPNLPVRGRYVSLRLVSKEHPEWAMKPVAYFIPEHVADPSRRAAGEELWVEVSVPREGAPRPIQLGVKKDGKLTPLNLR